jgi:hypothetical protein
LVVVNRLHGCNRSCLLFFGGRREENRSRASPANRIFYPNRRPENSVE